MAQVSTMYCWLRRNVCQRLLYILVCTRYFSLLGPHGSFWRQPQMWKRFTRQINNRLVISPTGGLAPRQETNGLGRLKTYLRQHESDFFSFLGDRMFFVLPLLPPPSLLIPFLSMSFLTVGPSPPKNLKCWMAILSLLRRWESLLRFLV